MGIIHETGARAHTATDENVYKQIQHERAHYTTLHTGDRFFVGEVRISVVWPETTYENMYPSDRNNTSLAFLLEYGQTSILFTGDAELDAEEFIGSRVGDIDVLKVGHHGSLTSSSWDFLQTTHPEYALVSVGEKNGYGHPHPTILQRLTELGVEVYRTDTQGDILVTSYGGEPSVTVHPLPF